MVTHEGGSDWPSEPDATFASTGKSIGQLSRGYESTPTKSLLGEDKRLICPSPVGHWDTEESKHFRI